MKYVGYFLLGLAAIPLLPVFMLYLLGTEVYKSIRKGSA